MNGPHLVTALTVDEVNRVLKNIQAASKTLSASSAPAPVTASSPGFFFPPPGGSISVGLSMPSSVFTVGGSPVHNSGILTVGFVSQSANLALMSPNGSTGLPLFRAILSVDVFDSTTLGRSLLTAATIPIARSAISAYPTYRASELGADLSSSVSVIGSTPAVLTVDSAITVNSNITIPATLQLVIQRPGLLSIATGATLTINSAFSASLYRIFSCAGTGKVVFGTGVVDRAYPQWWGAISDLTVTDNTAAFRAAIASMPWGGILYIQAGGYKITDELVCHASLTIQGQGSGDRYNGVPPSTDSSPSYVWQATPGKSVFTVGIGAHSVYFKDLDLGPSSAPVSTPIIDGRYGISYVGSNPGYVWQGGIERCTFYNFERGISIVDPSMGTPLDWSVCPILVTHCDFNFPLIGAYIGSCNADFWTFEQCGFFLPSNGSGVLAYRSGLLRMIDCFAGAASVSNNHLLHIIGTGSGGTDMTILDHCQAETCSNIVFYDPSGTAITHEPLIIKNSIWQMGAEIYLGRPCHVIMSNNEVMGNIYVDSPGVVIESSFDDFYGSYHITRLSGADATSYIQSYLPGPRGDSSITNPVLNHDTVLMASGGPYTASGAWTFTAPLLAAGGLMVRGASPGLAPNTLVFDYNVASARCRTFALGPDNSTAGTYEIDLYSANASMGITGALLLTPTLFSSTLPFAVPAGTFAGTVAILQTTYSAAHFVSTSIVRMAQQGNLNGIEGIAYGATGGLVLRGRCTGGTEASPTPTPAGYNLCQITGLGHDGSGSPFTTSSNAAINLAALNLWSNTDHSTQVIFRTTPSGSVTAANVVTIGADGAQGVGFPLQSASRVAMFDASKNLVSALPIMASFTPAAPTGTASPTFVMMGLGGTVFSNAAALTRMRVFVSGRMSNSAAGQTQVQLVYGSPAASAPANGAAPTGTQIGSVKIQAPTASAGMLFSIEGVITITPGTTYWFDLQVERNGAGTSTVDLLDFTIAEG